MIAGPNNFLFVLKNLVAGNTPLDGGFFKDAQSVVPDATSAPGGTTIRGDVFTIPRDYDEALDFLSLTFQARSSGATDTPTVDVTVVRTRVGEADLDFVNNVPLLTLSDEQQVATLDLSGNGLKAGDVLEFSFENTAHATDGIEKISAVPTYRSTIVSYNEFAADGETVLR